MAQKFLAAIRARVLALFIRARAAVLGLRDRAAAFFAANRTYAELAAGAAAFLAGALLARACA